MNGDIFHVHYNKFGGHETYESELGAFGTWAEAKAEINAYVTRMAMQFPALSQNAPVVEAIEDKTGDEENGT